MKLAPLVLFLGPLTANAAVLKAGASGSDFVGCVNHVARWLKAPIPKDRAIAQALQHCESLSDLHHSACPHLGDMLDAAFRREPNSKLFNAEAFCTLTEQAARDLSDSSKVPNMGKGSGFNFKLTQTCEGAALQAMAPNKELPAESAHNFWYSLCVNQDCAHFLPSRTRWCTVSHQPTHSAQVCESVRSFVKSHTDLRVKSHLKAGELCAMYDDFVEKAHTHYVAYMQVVHGKKMTHKHAQKASSETLSVANHVAADTPVPGRCRESVLYSPNPGVLFCGAIRTNEACLNVIGSFCEWCFPDDPCFPKGSPP